MKRFTEHLTIYNHQVINGHLKAKRGQHVNAAHTEHCNAVIIIITIVSKAYSNAKKSNTAFKDILK